MRKNSYLLLMLLSLLFTNRVWADSVSPYSMDFNTAILTGNHDFAVASNWGHIVGSGNYDGYGPYYMSYSYSETNGVDNSGALQANKQYAGDNWGGEVVYDLLVTPNVSGTVTLQVKATVSASPANPAFVEFYSLNETATAKNELLARFDDLSKDEWTTATVEIAEGQRIGIRGQYVFMDDFTATSADITPEKKLTILSVADVDGASTTYWNQQEDGTILAKYLVTLKNSGDVDLNVGDENYTLSLFARNNASVTYGEFPVPVAIAKGATSEPFVMEVSLPSSVGTSWRYWDVKENISGTTLQGRNVGINAYESKFVFDKTGTTYYSNPSPTYTPINFGKINESTTLNYEIYNAGTAPLTINSITLTAPFTTDATTTEFVVAAKEKVQVPITLPVDNFGVFTGNIEIVYTNHNKPEATYTLAMNGTVIDPSKNLITFDEDGQKMFPDGSIHPDGIYLSTSGAAGSEDWNAYLQSSSSAKMFVTPLLHADAGESFTFDAWYSSYNSSAVVKVYTSKDRQNWTELKNVPFSDLSQNAKTFVATIEEEGDYYLGFTLDKTLIDNIYGLTKVDVEHDWYLSASNVPATAKQNNVYTATASLINISSTIEEAPESYTATLYFGDEVIEAETVALPSNGNTHTGEYVSNLTTPTVFTFTYKPHAVGTFPAYIEFKSGDYTLATQPVDVTVSEEVLSSEVVIGTASATSTYVPFYTPWMDVSTHDARADFAYTPEQLTQFGLAPGSVIKSIKFVGTPTTTKTINSLSADAWVALQPAGNITAGDANKDEMTHVALYSNETFAFQAGENYDFVIDLSSSPITWDGESNIRICTNIDGNGDYININFDCDASYSNAYYTRGVIAWSSAKSPVAIFSLEVEPTSVSGKVVEAGTENAIANANVKIYNEEFDVLYTGASDENGEYEIPVIQSDFAYTVTVTAEGYLDDVQEVEFSNGSVALTHEMKREYTVSGVVTDAQTEEPMPEVAVKLMNGEEVAAEATTDEEGKYTFTLLSPLAENYTLTAEMEGYNPFSEEMTITEQQTEKNIALTHVAYKVSGTVTDEETGEAIINAQVSLNDILTNTDGEGYYEVMLAWPVDESYTLSAKAEGYADVVFDVAITDQSTVKDFTMLKLRNVVSGKVTDTAGAAIEGVTITLTKGDETIDATTDADGNYAITVIQADGDYSFKASKAGYGDFDATLTFAGEDLIQDVVLYTDEELRIGGINANGSRISAGKDGIIVEGADGTVVNIYNYAGQLIRSERVSGGTVKIELPQGLYIVNGVKLTVK